MPSIQFAARATRRGTGGAANSTSANSTSANSTSASSTNAVPAELPSLAVPERLRWGILGTGAIADRFASELPSSRAGQLVAVGSRNLATARAFAGKHDLKRGYGEYQDVLEDPDVDAVYIATPHPGHAQWAVRAAEAGKHVLCEKPLTLHRADAESVVEAARENRVFLMEAFMYRCHPQTRRVVELLRDGAIGELRVIEAVHSFRGSDDRQGRLLNPELGGGGILDVGCYCVSAARLMAGTATGAGRAIDPVDLSGRAHVGPSEVDEWAVAVMKFPGETVAHVACGVQVDQQPALRLHGSAGTLEVLAPWLPGIDGARRHEISVIRRGTRQTVVVTSDMGLYAIEADEVAACIARGEVESDAMPWTDTLGNMASLDRWRRDVGVVYPAERPASLGRPVHGRSLTIRPNPLPRRPLPGAPRDVSRAVLGTMLALGDETWPGAMAVFDAFFERGGNAFDTARRYGRGESDRALGHWMDTRGVRPDVVVIAKGAHTPHCDPDTLTRELELSLRDLRTDYVDLYFLHRDNLDVPVAEFVDVLNEHHRSGRIRAFGGSNWSMARLDEANAYAERAGLVGFSAVSNQYSLARMVRPTFPGCLAASGPEWQAWLARTGMPVVAWSSQAAGFFTGAPLGRLAGAWRDPGNFARRDRAVELGASLGLPATTVALAWVLGQQLPIFPVIGPRNLAELRTSLWAFSLELSPAQLAWLDLEGDAPRP